MATNEWLLRDAPFRFWTWWTAELAGMAEMLSPSRLGLGAADLVAFQDANGAWSAGSNTGRATTSSPLQDVVNPKRTQTVRLRLSAADCFVRRVALPNVARSEVARLLDLDLERATPFKTSETYSDHVIETARARPGFVNVLQIIVPRDVIDAKRAVLTSLGLRVTEIDCSDADAALAPLNFLTAASADGAPASARHMWRWLIPIAIFFVGSAAAIDISRHDAANSALVAQTSDALAIAKAKRETSQSAEAALAQTEAVQHLAEVRVPRTHILNELSRVLPDSAWLTNLKIDGAVLDISGHAKGAAELVGLFETSGLFTEAELTSAITRVETLERERFSIRVRIKGDSGGSRSSSDRAVAAP